jgi:hypothetical protein
MSEVKGTNKACLNPKCKKQYYCCISCNTSLAFRWRDVACSPKCFVEYMQFIEELQNIPKEGEIDEQ